MLLPWICASINFGTALIAAGVESSCEGSNTWSGLSGEDSSIVSLLQVDLHVARTSHLQSYQRDHNCVPFDNETGQRLWLDPSCSSLQRAPFTNDTASFCLCRDTSPHQNISQLIDKYQCQAEPIITSAFMHLDSLNITLNSDFIATAGGDFYYPIQEIATFGRGGIMRFDLADQQVDITPKQYIASWGSTNADSTKGWPKLFLDIAQEVRLPNISFLISMADGSPAPHARQLRRAQTDGYEVAQSGVWRTEGRPGVDLLSLPRSMFDWGGVVASMFKKEPDASYSPTSFAVFRGRDTGLGFRQEIRNFSKLRPDLLDAGHSHLSDEQQMRFQAVVVIDGNSLADRLPRQMAYGIPVVLVHPLQSLNEFWYHEMTPWEHYVPASVFDLELTLDTLQRDPNFAHQIGLNGKRFIEERLSERRLRCYMYRMLQEYAARFQN